MQKTTEGIGTVGSQKSVISSGVSIEQGVSRKGEFIDLGR